MMMILVIDALSRGPVCETADVEIQLLQRYSDTAHTAYSALPHGGWPMAAGPVSRLGSFVL